jgi:hypothetical protein
VEAPPDLSQTEAPGEPAAYELAYHEALRARDLQVASLDSLRTRAGLILSTSALVAGFLGPSVVRGHTFELLPAVGGASFVLAALISIALLLGIGRWRAITGTRELLANYVESDPPATLSEIHRSLAWHMEDAWTSNERRLRLMNRFLGVAGALVGTETIVWLVSEAVNGG